MSADKDARIAELEEESARLHMVAVSAKQELRNETRKYDERLSELERKLAEQQAALFTIRAIVAGCYSDESTRTIRHLQKHFDNQHAELDNLLAKAKEEGRKEAVPEGWQVVTKCLLDAFPEINPSNYGEDEVMRLNQWGIAIVLAAAPKPQGETNVSQ